MPTGVTRRVTAVSLNSCAEGLAYLNCRDVNKLFGDIVKVTPSSKVCAVATPLLVASSIFLADNLTCSLSDVWTVRW